MIPDFTQPINFLLTALFIFTGIATRYFGVAMLFSYIFGRIFKEKFAHRTVNTRPRRNGQNTKEIMWSMQSAAIFTAITMCIVLAFQLGYTRIYLDFYAHSIAYFIFSIVVVLITHETYYYWLHRLMHHPKVYKHVHKAHHDSITTSAFTSFSFHPIESLLQAIIIPALTLLLPLHLYAIVIVTIIMTTTSVINHLNIELYPAGTHKHWAGKWFIGATHHSLHHSQYLFNYGLYFTFWDKIMHTESDKYAPLFEEKTK